MTMASEAFCSDSVLVATFKESPSGIERSGLVGGIGPFLGMMVALFSSVGSKVVNELFSEVTSLGFSDCSKPTRVLRLLWEDMTD
jgi:hypothetical protein